MLELWDTCKKQTTTKPCQQGVEAAHEHPSYFTPLCLLSPSLHYLFQRQSGLSSVICSLIKKLHDLIADLCPGLRLQPVLEFYLVSIHQGLSPGLVAMKQATAVKKILCYVN